MNQSEIIQHLQSEHNAFADFIASLSETDLYQAQPGKWNAAQQLRHVYLCLRPIKLAASLPHFLPLLLFGSAKKASSSYDALVQAYQEKLRQGGKAPSIYVPGKGKADIEKSMQALKDLVNSFCVRIGSYDEPALDRIVLPHPLLGKLTMRELLYFAIYHVGHHHQQCKAGLEH